MSRSNVFGECRLCHQHEHLCESHIVPEWCYSTLYDPRTHTAVEIAPGPGIIRKRTRQKGAKKRLLCSVCESERLAPLEDEFRRDWYRSMMLSIHMRGWALVPLRDLDRFRLFHLSIFWRACEASGYDLGSAAERLRLMLLTGSLQLAPDEYPILGTLLLDGRRIVNDHVSPVPVPASLNGMDVYVMCYAGCEWVFYITAQPIGELAEAVSTAYEFGALKLPVTPIMDSNGMSYFLRRVRELGHRV